MKKRQCTLLIVLSLTISCVFAQNNWEPQIHITGYINTIAEATNQENYREVNKDIGIGLSEVGFLASYKPMEKLELKSTLIYSHSVADIQTMVVEAYGMYTFDSKFKVGAGKFLAPLSPINVYFYAPLNPSGVLPMVVSHHAFSPQSVSGLQLAGEFGDKFKAGYNLTYGNYTTIGHVGQGVINLIGQEDLAHQEPARQNKKQNYDLGGSARLYCDYNNMVSLGLNYFDGTRATKAVYDMATNQSIYLAAKKYGIGGDLHFRLLDEKLKLNGEYWHSNFKTTEGKEMGLQEEIDVDYIGYYAEALFEIGAFTPFVRYEYLCDTKIEVYAGFPNPAPLPGIPTVEIDGICGGLAYRPIYEIMLKFDYRYLTLYHNESAKLMGLKDQSYNHFILSAVISF